TALVPGLLYMEKSDGTEEYLAVDEGILVKCGQEVTVSTQNAIRGYDLGNLRNVITKHYRQLTEQDRKTRSALTNLHADVIRRLLEIKSLS
ncbi:MAG: F0F1 ATP synthase subunit epsilon, partial [Anaerolineaceae bacterium]|nr:F0F1 ATP synthase subunit epsilon [Anaerolineaceae bacterium]